MNLDAVVAFLGWNTVVHLAALGLSMAMLRWGWPLWAYSVASTSGLAREALRAWVLKVLVVYKTVVWTVFAVPYIVLKWLM